MANHDIIVSLHDVSVEYEGTVALQGVNLDIYADDFLGVIGPNGGGKTSLVKAIMGSIPFKGKIDYSPTPFRSEERRVGKERKKGCSSRWSPYHRKKHRESIAKSYQAYS